MKDWVVDLSYYQKDMTEAQWNALQERGIAGVVIRMCSRDWIDIAAAGLFEKAFLRSIPAAGYHWCDPTGAIDPQIVITDAAIGYYEPVFLADDVEQWWSDWNAFYRAIRGEIPWSQVPRYSEAYLNAWYLEMAQKKRQLADLHGLQLVMYTAPYMAYYIPEIYNIANQYYDAMWIAERRQLVDPNGDGIITWSEFFSNIDTMTMPDMAQFTKPLAFHQFGAHKVATLPILDHNKQYQFGRVLFGYETLPPAPPPPVTPPVERVRLRCIRQVNVREDPWPTAPDVGDVLPGALVYVDGLSVYTPASVWVQHKDGWSAIVHNGVQFFEAAS